MYTERPERQKLLENSLRGDRAALELLILSYCPDIERRIKSRLPPDMKALIGAEDVLQETFAEVFRRMGTFDGTTTDAFWGWISMIADHRLADMVRAQRSAKRNRGGRVTNVPKGGDMSTAGELFAILKLHEHTPSRSFARREAVSAVQVALASLKEEYRKALRMRYIEGLPVARIAEAMGRTEGSVNMLCNRGLTKLREAMGRASAYLSR